MTDEIPKQNTMQNLPIFEPECVLSSESDDIFDALSPFLAKELEKADPSETKAAIVQKFWFKVGKSLGITYYEMGIMIQGKSIRVHAGVCEMVRALFESIRDTGVKCDNLKRHVTAFNSTTFHETSELKSLVREFVKYKEMNKDPNNQNKKDKVLKDNSLNIILAVDGMLGKEVSDLGNYINNFSVGKFATTKEEQHVVAVREMYKKIPEMITGTDSTYLIAQTLLYMYNEYNDENSDTYPIVKEHVEKCRDYLWKQGDYYKELNEVTNAEFVQELKNIYTSKVDVKEVAREKLDQFISALKKKNVNESKKNEQTTKKRKGDEEDGKKPKKHQKSEE
jgi:hypothetical protein